MKNLLKLCVVVLLSGGVLGGCEDSAGEGNATATDTSATSDTTATTEDTSDATATTEDTSDATATTADTTDPTDTPDAPVERFEGEALVLALPGLWSGSASRTPLGTFPLMNMDLRAVGDSMLFSRTDLDPDNSLRFAFSLETHGAQEVLVFRNGGQFTGLDRDTRTILQAHDPTAKTWQFCALDGGCGYVDATWTLHSNTSVTLQVMVGGNQHLTWEADRVEERTLPPSFPSTTAIPGDSPFPDMPTLDVTVSWSDALTQDSGVWIIVSTTACGFTGRGCESSRAISAVATAGSTSVSLRLNQIHPGDYFLNAILDRNGNIQSLVFPDSGDGIALPDKAITVNPTGTSTATSNIAVTVP